MFEYKIILLHVKREEIALVARVHKMSENRIHLKREIKIV